MPLVISHFYILPEIIFSFTGSIAPEYRSKPPKNQSYTVSGKDTCGTNRNVPCDLNVGIAREQ